MSTVDYILSYFESQTAASAELDGTPSSRVSSMGILGRSIVDQYWSISFTGQVSFIYIYWITSIIMYCICHEVEYRCIHKIYRCAVVVLYSCTSDKYRYAHVDTIHIYMYAYDIWLIDITYHSTQYIVPGTRMCVWYAHDVNKLEMRMSVWPPYMTSTGVVFECSNEAFGFRVPGCFRCPYAGYWVDRWILSHPFVPSMRPTPYQAASKSWSDGNTSQQV
jgi:hypothetical protein